MASSDNFKELEFLAAKSKELLEKQIDSYRQKNSYASTIIGVSALFIPFFLNGLDNSHTWVKYISLVPVALFVCAIFFMLTILRTKPLFQSFSSSKFKEYVNKSYEENLLFEIGANVESFNDNKPITARANTIYNQGVLLTIVAFLLSISLLLINNFFKPVLNNRPIQVEIINPIQMSKSILSVDTTEKPRIIPSVPPGDRERLNEGVDRPLPPSAPPPKPKPNTKEK